MQRERLADYGLLLARLVAGGTLLIAGYYKLRGGPLLFQGAIEAFKLFPDWSTAPLAFWVPWLEIVLGLALVVGLWTREAALPALVLLIAFTIALASVILRGLDVDCGCFGGLFGEGSVGWSSVGRNALLMVFTAIPLALGGGRFSLTRPEART